MKIIYLKRMLFISKSLLWSLLLYATAITVINWEDVMKSIRKNEVAVITHQANTTEVVRIANSSPILGIVKGIWFCLSGIENKKN